MNLKPNKLDIKERAVLGMLSALMYASKVVMDFLPNIHLLGAFIVAMTVVFRAKALFSIYTFVFITGLLSGFSIWWIPYLYIWTVLWLFTMLLPKNMSPKIAPIIYMIISALHGFLYGTLYAPTQALMFGLDFEATIAWIIAGLSFDFIHGISNFFCGVLIVPIIKVLNKSQKI